jgi:hypothetical protein
MPEILCEDGDVEAVGNAETADERVGEIASRRL